MSPKDYVYVSCPYCKEDYTYDLSSAYVFGTVTPCSLVAGCDNGCKREFVVDIIASASTRKI